MSAEHQPRDCKCHCWHLRRWTLLTISFRCCACHRITWRKLPKQPRLTP